MAHTTRPLVLICAVALIVQAGVLYAMGQPPICACGTVRLWVGAVLSPENSQQLTDWYTPSHVIHGMLFFALGRLLFRGRWSPVLAVALALGIEIAWELIENSPPVIARYREQALAQGYSGDSVLNSLCDTLAMLAGFCLAARLPVRASIALALAAELFTGLMIRDNLTLNVIQLIVPSKNISAWQAEGGLYGASTKQ
ncbi:DUF2585 family protein [Pleomorphomonas sp. PLEO]|uniref:DUF2585 family protein n=1 Tax=Pleomorphomonas sp. PLEO TaxID=3239306 RepID=UPI00351E0A87